MSLTYTSSSISETMAVAQNLASAVKTGDVIILEGDLGVGKTQFVKGLAESLGVAENVTSPTFSLVNSYKTDKEMLLHHLDVYRLTSSSQINDLGLDELIETGVVVIEWGNQISSALPDTKLLISFKLLFPDESRTGEEPLREIFLTPLGAWGERLKEMSSLC